MPKEHHSILIVDDSAVTRTVVKRTIGMTGLDVGTLYEAGDGKAALELMRANKVDLVLADLNMPVMDGFEMIHAMRQDDNLRAIPVVVISAQPDGTRIEQMRHDGVLGYLPKPFTPEGVRDLIGPVLKRKASKAPQTAQSDASFNLTLIEALAEALETMAFISPELPKEKGLPAPSPEFRVITVGFRGHGIQGSLVLAAPAAFGTLIAENCCDDTSEIDADDALKELTNITCGSLLRRRIGGAVGFELALPVVNGPEEMERLFHGNDVVVLNADGHLVAAHVVTDVPMFESGVPQS
jgi:two-component system, chemotaxis family, chemotaxis protein CheY